MIPNLEIRQIFIDQIREWFQEEVRKDTPMLDAFCRAFLEADVSNIEKSFNQYLGRTISIRDTNVRKVKKKTFITGFSWDCSAIGKTGILILMLSQETDTAIFWWKQKKIQDL